MLKNLILLLIVTILPACSDAGQDLEGDPLLPKTPALKNRPNILIVISDDLGIDEAGAYGNKVIRTPNLDQLANDGLKFNQAFVPASMCSPSRAALYSGLYPHRNGMYKNHAAALPGVKSIPHYLTALGYRTALAGKIHVKPFEAFPFEYIDRDLDDVSDFLDKVDDTPFALVIAQHHPHVPWVSNDGYDPDQIPLSPKLVDTPETRAVMTRYYSSVTESDKELGQFLALLDKRGLRENTVVIYLSDHGPQMPFAKFSNYDASLRVPFIVRWPGVITASTRTNALINSVDILPTIIEIAGGKAPADLDGKSLVHLFQDPAAPHHDYVFGSHNTLGLKVEGLKPYGIRTVRNHRYRYVRNLNPENTPRSFTTDPRPLSGSLKYLMIYGAWVPPGVPAYWQSWVERAKVDDKARDAVNAYLHRPAEELFDLERDPYELHNLASDSAHKTILYALSQKLDAWMIEQGDASLKQP